MSSASDKVPLRRAIIDRRALADRLALASRAEAAALLADALAAGRADIAGRLTAAPYAGTESATATAFLTDQIVRLAHDYVVTQVHPLGNPTAGERLLLLGLGGYGRGEMAPHSDVDIAL